MLEGDFRPSKEPSQERVPKAVVKEQYQAMACSYLQSVDPTVIETKSRMACCCAARLQKCLLVSSSSLIIPAAQLWQRRKGTQACRSVPKIVSTRLFGVQYEAQNDC